MTTVTKTIQYVQANLDPLLDQLEAGTVDDVAITKDTMSARKVQSQVVIGKIVTYADFIAADVGLNTNRSNICQSAFMRSRYNFVKKLTAANAEVDASVKALLQKGGTVSAAGQITVVAGAALIDGETFTLNDGINAPVVFEFNDDATVTPGNVAVGFTGGSTTAQVRDAMITAINDVIGTLLITASNGGAAIVTLVNDGKLASGNTTISDTVADAGFIPVNFAGAGDITYTAKDGGSGGNSITVALVNTGAVSVVVTTLAIVVNFNAGVTTLTQIKAADRKSVV